MRRLGGILKEPCSVKDTCMGVIIFHIKIEKTPTREQTTISVQLGDVPGQVVTRSDLHERFVIKFKRFPSGLFDSGISTKGVSRNQNQIKGYLTNLESFQNWTSF